MRFAIIRKADETTEKGCMPSNELLLAMGQYNQALAEAGVLRGGDGLRPSSDGLRIRFHKGKPTLTDGPFAETRELIAGYTVIEVDSKEEAIEWAKKWPVLDGEGEVELELRQYFEMEDFEQGEGLELHREVEAKMVHQPADICTYLFFDGNCREAFEFYADCLGGHIEGMMSEADAPNELRSPEAQSDRIMHACMSVGKMLLMGSDVPAEQYRRPQGFCVQLAINDVAQAEHTFAQFADGGLVHMPLAQTFWAERFGIVQDRFGTPWMINCGAGSNECPVS